MSLNNSASTVLNYYVDPGKDGDHSFFDGTIIESRREYAEVPVQVMDLRRQEQRFSLDRQGFQLLMHPSIEKDFDDTARIKDVYYRECAEVLQNMYVLIIVPISLILGTVLMIDSCQNWSYTRSYHEPYCSTTVMGKSHRR